MSETELSVICKNCGSEVSPYVTECPYCGARLRKRAPKLERRGDALEAQQPRKRRRRIPRLGGAGFAVSAERPYATLTVILGSAILLLVQKATGYALGSFGGLVIPFQEEWWRYFTAPFAYVDVGFLFVVSLALAIFSTGVERRLGTVRTAILLLACGTLGMVAADAVASSSTITVIAGGNGMALGAIAAWFVVRRAEVRGAVGEDFDLVGVAVCAVVVILLPLFAPTADWIAGLAGGVVGALCGLAATAFQRGE
ncbi:MAG TPA: rhomboid family intramembrane serine protease [Solirubrobacterales bacterium]|nr:rhomboid family intramembrane serine protease [Solirubrobacterales bacterium]